jgi:ATP synthase F0 subunit b
VIGGPLQEILREIAARPLPFAAEVVQFLLLAAVILWAGRRPLGKRLDARRAKIAAQLAEAERSDRECVAMIEEARAVVARAEQEAPRVVEAARERAAAEREAAAAEVEAEASRAVEQARGAVERERERIAQDLSERLVRLTTETARRYLDELLTDSERQALARRAMLESLEELERGASSRPE